MTVPSWRAGPGGLACRALEGWMGTCSRDHFPQNLDRQGPCPTGLMRSCGYLSPCAWLWPVGHSWRLAGGGGQVPGLPHPQVGGGWVALAGSWARGRRLRPESIPPAGFCLSRLVGAWPCPVTCLSSTGNPATATELSVEMGSWPMKSGKLADWCSMEDGCQALSQATPAPREL